MSRGDFLKRLAAIHRVRLTGELFNLFILNAAFFSACLALLSLADIVFPLSFRIRAFSLFFLSLYFMLKVGAGLLKICSKAREKSARAAGDEALRAWDFSLNREKLSALGLSGQLMDEEIKSAAQVVKAAPLRSFLSLKVKALAALALASAVLFLNSLSARRVIAPRRDDIANYVSVEMSETAVKGEPWELLLRAHPAARPRAIFSFPSSPRVERRLEGGDGLFSFKIDKCLEPFKLRFRWKNLYSEIYEVKLLERPRVLSRALRIHYPAYLNLPPEDSSFGAFSAFPGTVAELSIKASARLESAAIVSRFGEKEERISMEVSADTAKGSFSVSGAGEWQIEMLSREGLVSSGTVVWKVDEARDNPPLAYIISPAEDLIINESFSGIEISWLAEDDFGVKEVFFCFSKNGGAVEKVRIFDGYSKSSAGRWMWKLSRLMAADDVTEYWIEAVDAGGFSSESRRFSITFRDFLLTHRQNMKREEALKDDIFALYQRQAELNLTRETLTPDELIRLQEEVENKLLSLSEDAARAAANAEKDPLYSSYYSAEYRGLSRALDSLATESGRARSDMASGETKEAFDKQDGIADSLEKLSAFSEDLFKRSSMDNMGNIARESIDAADKLHDFLSSGGADDEMLKELGALGEKIEKLMRELAETLSNMPQNLPEEFVNADSVKSMDFNSAQSSLAGLQDALSSGDISSALEHAQSLLESLNTLRQNLESGFSSVGAPSLPQGEQDSELAEIISAEEKIIAESEELLLKYRNSLKETSELTAQKLREGSESLRALSSRLLRDRNSLFAADAARLSQGLNNFNRNISDFADRFRDKGFDFERPLDDARKQLGALAAMELSSSTAKILEEASADMNDFFSLYHDTSSRPMNQAEMHDALEISSSQAALARRSAVFEKKVRDYSRQSAQFPAEIAENVRLARREMLSAASSMKEGRAEESLGSQEKALYQLRKAQSGMEDFEFSPQGEPGASGMPSFFPASGPGGASGGHSSTGAGFRQQDFSIPRALRPAYDAEGEIINDAMRGERPLKYRDMLKEYYEQLLK